MTNKERNMILQFCMIIYIIINTHSKKYDLIISHDFIIINTHSNRKCVYLITFNSSHNCCKQYYYLL